MEKPYWVRYKAKKNPAIKPGIHGKFADENEAKLHVLKAREWFDTDFGAPDAAHVGVWVDQAALERQKQEEEGDGFAAEEDTTIESQPIEAVPFLAELLESDHGLDATTAADLCQRHARLITKHLKSGPFSLKKMREVVTLILKAEDNAGDKDAEKESMQAEIDRLRAELEAKGKKKKARVE